jgi:hypothetical protein
MRTVISGLEIVATLFVVTRMVIVGLFTKSPFHGVFSWPMFTHFSAASIDVEVLGEAGWEPVNIFDLTPSGVFTVASGELQDIVDYLMRHYADVRGEGTILYADGEFPIRIVGGQVEVGDIRVAD